MSDDDSGSEGFYTIGVLLMVCVVSGYCSFNEIRYAMYGKSTNGSVTKLEPMEFRSRRWGGSKPGVEATIAYREENGETRTFEEAFELDAGAAIGNSYTVYYLPGNPNSGRRFAIHWTTIGFFAASALALLVIGGQNVVAAHVATSDRPRTKKKKKRRPPQEYPEV